MMDEQRIVRLIRRAQSGNGDAFGELIKHFESTVFATVLRRMRNRSEASEVTQDVFMQAMCKLSQLRDPQRFAGWLRRIAVRMSINRGLRRPKERPFNPQTFHSVRALPQTPLDDLMRNEASHQVWGGLERLRELDRKTLIAFYFEGHSLREMSDEFNSPIGTIKRRLHTARNRLREELADMQSA